MNGGKVYNCTNGATVINRDDSKLQVAGGIVGYIVVGTQSAVISCINYADVSAPNATRERCRGVGGIVGFASSNSVVSGVVNLGKVTASFGDNGAVGAIIGELSGERGQVDNAYWLNDNGGTTQGRGISPINTGSQSSNYRSSSFSGQGLNKNEINSSELAENLNRQFVSIANRGRLDSSDLRMFGVVNGRMALTNTFGHIELLPKFAPEWILSNNSTAYKWLRQTSGANASFDEVLKITPSGKDPITKIQLAVNEQFSADQYHFVAIKMKTKSTVNVGAVFFGTDKFPGPVAECRSPFEVKNDGKWHDYIIDMSSYQHNRWQGNVNVLRIDPIDDKDTQASIWIERIGVFQTRDQAEAFLNSSSKKEQVFEDSIQKVYISDEVTLDGTNREEFMLKDNTLPQQKPHKDAQTVVSFTDENVNTSIVPICFVDDDLFSHYIASRTGKYTLTYAYKEYLDVPGHWSAEYVDFVSARGLFNGTSATEFSPDQTMTRAMFITVLARMHGVQPNQYAVSRSSFDDVDVTQYYAPFVEWALEKGIIGSVVEKNFYPDYPITRCEMANMMYRYINAFSYSMQNISQPIEFSDISDKTADYQTAIITIQRYGIVNGKGGNIFDPDGNSTRAEVATVMTRLIKGILGILQQ